jgi:chaperonin cofactor prefoldin
MFHLIGVFSLKIKGRSCEAEIETMTDQHNKELNELRKKYEKDRKAFNKLELKIQKIIADFKKKEA